MANPRKRQRSPEQPESSGKRQRKALQLDSLPEGLLLSILLRLDSAQDLAVVSQCSSKWRRLAADSQLWKRLFLLHHTTSDTDALVRSCVVEDGHWKALYRLQTNWQNGSAASTNLRRAVLPEPPLLLMKDDVESSPKPNTIVAFSGRFLFTASKRTSHAIPPVSLNRICADNSHEWIGDITSASLELFLEDRPHILRSPHGVSISELRIDEAAVSNRQDHVRIAVFYSTGHFALFRVTFPTKTKEFAIYEEFFSPVDATTPDPVIAARLNCPLLVTCSSRFVLQIWTISKNKTDGTITVHNSRPPMQSSFCWKPLVLNLQRAGRFRFKASITYSTPFFPSSMTIAAQEFVINLPKDDSGEVDVLTQAAVCIPPPDTARPSRFVTSIQRSNQFIVASRADNTIDVYRVIPAASNRLLQIKHMRTLFGHTTSVTSVSISNSKVVSAGRDGVKVWDLAEYRPLMHRAGPVAVQDTSNATSEVGWLDFDDEKIVVVDGTREQVKVLSFV